MEKKPDTCYRLLNGLLNSTTLHVLCMNKVNACGHGPAHHSVALCIYVVNLTSPGDVEVNYSADTRERERKTFSLEH